MMKISALSRQYDALLDGCFLVCSNYLVFSNINQNGFSKFCKLKLNTEVTLPCLYPGLFSKHSTLVTKLNFVTHYSLIHAEGFF